MKKILPILLFTIFSLISYAQEAKYARAKINLDSKELTIKKLSKLGLAVDHGDYKKNVHFISDFSYREISLAKENGFTVEILIEDVTKHYVDQNKEQAKKKKSGVEKSLNNRNTLCSASAIDGIETPANFQLGSMGGYYTYAELLSQLTNMANLFPNLITIKDTIGNFASIEGRPIYWVKISDNPNVTENEPEVLYTSIHHAREPASVSQMIFYMWYLLENYSGDTEIQALVNNTEMYFVPCVNPDGYVYNQTTDPNGGGMWRKNRRDNNDGTFGVDLNRNYGYFWGYDNTGSSNNTNDETYRGTAAFSEPETQAIKYFCEEHQFKICLNYHTYGDLLIYPWGYEYSIFTPDSAIFVNYAQLLTTDNNYIFGTGDQTVGYITNGDSDDWMYGEQSTKSKILSMTPEAGDPAEGFWPPQSNITNICKSNVSQNLNMALLAGKYALLEDISPLGISEQLGYLKYNIKCLGMDTIANFTTSIIPIDSWITTVGAPKVYSNMNLMQIIQDSISYALDPSITLGQNFSYILRVNNGFYNNDDTIIKIYGQTTDVYSTDGSSLTDFTASGGGNWGISNTQFVSAPNSITDSPTGNYNDDSYKLLTLNDNINLSTVLSATLNFWAKWEIEANYDFAQVEVSEDGGSSWIPLCGKYTKAGSVNQDLDNPLYDGTQTSWVLEEMNLADYIGKIINIRFKLVSDNYENFDGFYFDDLSISTVSATTKIGELKTNSNIISQNTPNPANSITYIDFKLNNNNNNNECLIDVYNTLGELVKQENIAAKQTSIALDISALSNGTYFYCIVKGSMRSNMRRMVILK